MCCQSRFWWDCSATNWETTWHASPPFEGTIKDYGCVKFQSSGSKNERETVWGNLGLGV
jgi:hypothetical protein